MRWYTESLLDLILEDGLSLIERKLGKTIFTCCKLCEYHIEPGHSKVIHYTQFKFNLFIHFWLHTLPSNPSPASILSSMFLLYVSSTYKIYRNIVLLYTIIKPLDKKINSIVQFCGCQVQQM